MAYKALLSMHFGQKCKTSNIEQYWPANQKMSGAKYADKHLQLKNSAIFLQAYLVLYSFKNAFPQILNLK